MIDNPDRERWNSKYIQSFVGETEPSELLVEFTSSVCVGRALDVAAGFGRNSLFLAERGFIVDAVDISDIAIERLRSLHENIIPIHADLAKFRPPPNMYDLIVNVNFLERSLFPYLVEALKVGGFLLFETFMVGSPSKTNKDFLLRKNELLHAFLNLRVMFYQEKIVINKNGEEAYKAYLVAKKEC